MSRKVFMPGCALPNYSPENVFKTVNHLKLKFPDISVVQKCCGKPTKAIGQAELFNERFSGLVEDIKYCEADEVIVACQSCMNTLKECQDYTTRSLWAILPEIGLPPEAVGKAKGSNVVFSVQDSCSVRDKTEIHNGIRWILTELGYTYQEADRTRENTRCCGFGGMVGGANPDVAFRVMKRRVEDFKTPYIVTYCAACRQSMLNAGGKAWHILDLVFGDVIHENTAPPEDVLANPVKAWKNRYRSKSLIKKAFR